MKLKEIGANRKKNYYINEGCSLYLSKNDEVFNDTVNILQGTQFFNMAVEQDIQQFTEKICERADKDIWKKYENFEIIQIFARKEKDVKFNFVIILKRK